MHEVENFFCQFPNPWTLRVSGMGGYTSKCGKKSKSLHPSVQPFQENIKFLLFSFIFGHFCTPGFCHQTQLNLYPDLERNTANETSCSRQVEKNCLPSNKADLKKYNCA